VKGLLSLLLFVLSTPLLWAADEEPNGGTSETLELLKEEQSVSIAVRHEQPISEAPSNVYVITDEDIRHSGATDLPTVLRRIPGIEVIQMSGAQFDVSVRGDNQPGANKLLVLLDGRSIYIDIQGAVLWKAIPVTLPEIKRIEVLKGPASAVYGFNAFDGIINIITKPPEEMEGTTLQFGGGEFGTLSSAAVYARTHGPLGYRISIGEDQNQEWRDRDALAFRSYKANVQTKYALHGNATLNLSAGILGSNRFDGTITETVLTSSKPVAGYAYADYSSRNFFLRGWWNGYNIAADFATNPLLSQFQRVTTLGGSPSTTYNANTYNIEGQHSVEIWHNNIFSYGFNYRYNTLSAESTAGFRAENRLGAYIQDEWQLMPKIRAVVGARYDLDTFIKPTLSPRVSLLYQLASEHTLRVGMSMAYRPPTLAETYQQFLVTTSLPSPIPPPRPLFVQESLNSEPEKIISYEVEYQGWYLKHRLLTRGALFFNHISNLITNRAISPTIALNTNDPGQADIYGGEAGMEFLMARWLSGFVNLSYQEIGQSFTGTARRGAPQFKYNVGLRGEWENGLNGEIGYHYYGSATYPVNQAFFAFAPFGAIPPNPHVGSYNLLNIRAGYRLWHQKAAAGYLREAEVAVSAFNALNDRHKEHPLGDTIGSRVMGWLTLKF
jgi:iron complex outermembrane recepter protein